MHDDDGNTHTCKDCGSNLMWNRLKTSVHIEIADLEDLLHEIRAGLITNVRFAPGITEDDIVGPGDFEWDTLPGGRS